MRVWRRPSLWVNTALCVLALAGAGWAYQTVSSSRTTSTASTGTTRRVTVTTGAVTATVSATGTVSSANQAGANFITSGTVTEIDVQVGSTVTKGQVLAKVDPSAANENLTTARANLQAAEDALARAQSSATSDAATISAAQAQVDSAQATVDADQRAVNGTVLTAPIAGTVIAVSGSVGNPSSSGSSGTGSGSGSGSGGATGGGGGANANSSSTSSSSSSSSATTGFVTIADLTQMQVTASFAEADATKLKVGQAANISWSALSGTRATGKVASISPTSTTSGGVNSYTAVISIDAVPDGVRIGQTTTVAVTTAEADNVLRVPVAAVTSAGGLHVVQVVNGNAVTRTPIQVGVQGNDYDEVTSGVTEGQVLQYTISTSTTTGTNGFPFGGGGGLGGLTGGGGNLRGGTGTGGGTTRGGAGG